MHVDATFHGTRVVFTDYIYGAVGGIAWTKNDYGNWNFDIYGLASDCVTPRQINVVNNFSDSYYQAGDFDFAELTLTRVDGLPDNCGDTLGALTPQAPGDGDYNKVLPVADPSGSGTLNLPFKVTLPPVSVSLPPVILDPLPVVLAPTLNLAVSFSLGGLTFNYYAGGDNPQHPFPPPSGQPSPPSQPAPPSDSRIGQILTNTNLLTTCGYDPCMHTKQTNVQVGSSFSFECPTGYYITSVLIHTSSYPSNTRVQSGGGVAPNIYYLGWYAFGYGDVGGDRLPISYLDQTVAPCAHGATGFSATLYSGCTGTATVFYQNDHS
jgi:hypothetical protein